MNKEWHLSHNLAPNATVDESIKWHLSHAKNCSCRPVIGEILQEMKKRYLGTHREFWLFYNRDDHRALASWAAVCAEHVLPYFESELPNDMRPRKAIDALRDWIETGTFSMSIIRNASLSAHAAARDAKKIQYPASYAARAAGQAVATAHVPTHALGSALYGVKAVAASNATDTRAAARERDWQLRRVPKRLKPWVVRWLDNIESKKSGFAGIEPAD